MTIDLTSAVVLALLDDREPGATICPSEVARRIAPADLAEDWGWRAVMPTVHDAVDRLLARHSITLSWKGRALLARSGPYRIGRASSSMGTAED
ncbi:MAG: DUF3253 domain-containing protein [Sphingomonas sp.]